MKKNLILTFSLIVLFIISFSSCGSTKVEAAEAPEETITSPVEEDDDVELVAEADEVHEEYLRSIQNIDSNDTVTVEEFEEDKQAILKIIEELSVIMENGDKTKWLTYIDPASVQYYSDIKTLRKVREKLPNKQIALHGIGDYFKYVFIPSRKRSQVDEIRYISKTNIKAVQIKESGEELIYYYFIKKDGKWYVHIPVLEP